MPTTKNTHDVNSLTVTDKDGNLRTLAPGEECEVLETVRNSQAKRDELVKAEEAARKAAAAPAPKTKKAATEAE